MRMMKDMHVDETTELLVGTSLCYLVAAYAGNVGLDALEPLLEGLAPTDEEWRDFLASGKVERQDNIEDMRDSFEDLVDELDDEETQEDRMARAAAMAESLGEIMDRLKGVLSQKIMELGRGQKPDADEYQSWGQPLGRPQKVH